MVTTCLQWAQLGAVMLLKTHYHGKQSIQNKGVLQLGTSWHMHACATLNPYWYKFMHNLKWCINIKWYQMLFALCCWILKVLLWSAVLLVAEVDNMYTSLMHLSSCSWAQLKPSITSWCARAMRFKPFDWLNFLSCRSPEPWESTDLGTAVI